MAGGVVADMLTTRDTSNEGGKGRRGEAKGRGNKYSKLELW
jgi:hypothetical protein